MKVVWSEEFIDCYAVDPAAESGRMEAIVDVIRDRVTFVPARPASEEDIGRCHTTTHIEHVRRIGIYDVAALSAGGAIQAAQIGMQEPCFGLIRPPGHHASVNSCWGFCYFNNMPIALERLRRDGKIRKALVLDIDLHFGDGTVDSLADKGYAALVNPSSNSPADFIRQVSVALTRETHDVIGISAGFDDAREDWGRLLGESDLHSIPRLYLIQHGEGVAESVDPKRPLSAPGRGGAARHGSRPHSPQREAARRAHSRDPRRKVAATSGRFRPARSGPQRRCSACGENPGGRVGLADAGRPSTVPEPSGQFPPDWRGRAPVARCKASGTSSAAWARSVVTRCPPRSGCTACRMATTVASHENRPGVCRRRTGGRRSTPSSASSAPSGGNRQWAPG